MEVMSPNHKLPWTFLLLLAVCVIAALFCAAYPLYVIRPFRAQGREELALALQVMRIRPVLTLVFLGLAALAAYRLWTSNHRLSRWPRVSVAAAFGLVCLSAAAVRINVFEIMFHPVANPTFAAAAAAKLDADEKVLAVKPNGAARAYPVRALAYHHIVNDVVGGLPIVATY